MFALVVLLAIPPASAAAADSWPSFRGPGSRGHAAASGLPSTWGEKKNVKWKTAIHGRAWSSPVILGDQIWLTTATPDGRKLSVLCVNRADGKILLDRVLFNVADPQFAHKFNTYASPSPVIEAGRVYVTFGSPGTACLDTKSFKVLWERTDFVCNHFRGSGSSPLLYGEKLIMNYDGSDHQFVVALDKNTGKTIWRQKRSIDYQDINPKTGKPDRDGDWRKAYSTPVIARFDGGDPVMLSLGSKALYAYEPDTGKEIWRVEERGNHSGGATPVVGHGLIFMPLGYSKGHLIAVRGGGESADRVAWRTKRAAPKKPSVLLIDDLIYMVDDIGIASCLDAKSGAEIWKERIGGNYSASPLYADGRIYFFSEEGKTTVIAPGREFKKLATNQLEEGFMASPAVAGKALYLRTKKALYRI
ncbi:MAG: PQQ-binding-like beta-propeller repeat protein, partial [Phycisphaerae bacterium]|nr:PQQ-binding-like beta-propeller repeat protein [Phycisphaerae bacterium]